MKCKIPYSLVYLWSFLLWFNHLKMGHWMEIKLFHRASLAYKLKKKINLRQCSSAQTVISFPLVFTQWITRSAFTKTAFFPCMHDQVFKIVFWFATVNERKHEVKLGVLYVTLIFAHVFYGGETITTFFLNYICWPIAGVVMQNVKA